MSAFIVTNSHISAIVGFYVANATAHYAQFSVMDAKAWGQRLLNRNVDSVNYRYQETDNYPVFKLSMRYIARPITPVECIKAISCLDYQACERDDWQQTEEFALLEKIKSCAINCLPGYELAPWCVDDEAKEADNV